MNPYETLFVMRIVAKSSTVEINNGVNDNRTLITRFSWQFIARDKHNAFRFTAAVIYARYLFARLYTLLSQLRRITFLVTPTCLVGHSDEIISLE